ncbi:MAG: DUF3343 domain-containing protein [Oscillospiraceae bacterium]|nr:DUF3343 domain-containing protein [Oscillospiraceae bacterium]
MDQYLLIARSVTQAQRMVAALERQGIRSSILRAPAALNPKGCSYAVRIGGLALANAQDVLNAAGIRPLRIYEKGESGYREVLL